MKGLAENGLMRRIPEPVRPVLMVVALFVVASGFLFFHIDAGLDPDRGKDWWTIAFDARDSASLDFTVTNHAPAHDFTYTVTADADGTVDSGSFSVATGDRKTIKTVPAPEAERSVVTVTASDGTVQSIYRKR